MKEVQSTKLRSDISLQDKFIEFARDEFDINVIKTENSNEADTFESLFGDLVELQKINSD